MFCINKELKAQADALLKEKLSDEQLDEVAGGSFDENQEILYAMMSVDPEGTMDLLKKWIQDFKCNEVSLYALISQLVDKNISGTGLQFDGRAYDDPNEYRMNGKRITHRKFLDHLKVMGQSDDF